MSWEDEDNLKVIERKRKLQVAARKQSRELRPPKKKFKRNRKVRVLA